MSESRKLLMDFSSRNVMQSAKFQKFISDNFDDQELIRVIAEVIKSNERDGGSSNNEQFFSKLRTAFEEKGLANKIEDFFNTTTNVATAPTRTTFNRTLSLDRPCSPNNNSTNIASLLDPKTSTDGCFLDLIKSCYSTQPLQPYKRKTSFQFDATLTVIEAADYGSHPLIASYSMKNKNRGVFFYVNIIKFGANHAQARDGAEKDRDNLITLFTEMNFTVFYYEDLTRDEFTNRLCLLIQSKHLKSTDSFVCCVQTHGEREGNLSVMKFSDGSTLATEQVISFFSNSSCPILANKPKVFIFPICRGPVSDQRILMMKTQTDCSPSSLMFTMPSYNDIIICYATVPGYKAHRDPEFGSWYIRELCRILALHAHDTHLEDLLKIVSENTMKMTDRQGEGVVQVASTENRGFNKLLFFNPKK